MHIGGFLHKVHANGITEWFSCRVCRGATRRLFDLGGAQTTNFDDPVTYLSDGEIVPAPEYLGHRVNDFPTTPNGADRISPLVLQRCHDCGLVQLSHTVPRQWLYTDYWYRSGINESMVRALEDIVKKARALVPVGDEDVVLDIGANDGTLLKAYDSHERRRPPFRIAYEPAENLRHSLKHHSEAIVPYFFPDQHREPVAGPGTSMLDHKPKIVTSIAMFYDLENPKAFVEAIRDILHPSGVWVVELQYWPQTLRNSAFDTICHEHLEYYSLFSFDTLVRRYSLCVFDYETNDVNGGSIRFYVKHMRNQQLRMAYTKISNLVQKEATEEEGLLRDFQLNMFTYWKRIEAWFRDEVVGPVDLYGASTKANTLLQCFDLGPEKIRQAIERSEGKVGRFTVNGIPIVSEEAGRSNPAQYWLIGPWHFRDGIVKREWEFLEKGGEMIFPLPIPTRVYLKESKLREVPL